MLTRPLILTAIAMALIVLASNILVQVRLGDWLTWGALTYPLAFLVTDLTNRRFGAQAARRVVWAGFAMGVACSLVGSQIMGADGPLVTLRIAVASGLAFLVAQMVDIWVFDRLRAGPWWRAPLASSVVGSAVDTALFFSIAFAPALMWLEPGNDTTWAGASVTPLGLEAPLWVGLALADLGVKLVLALLALAPFRAAVRKMAQPVG